MLSISSNSFAIYPIACTIITSTSTPLCCHFQLLFASYTIHFRKCYMMLIRREVVVQTRVQIFRIKRNYSVTSSRQISDENSGFLFFIFVFRCFLIKVKVIGFSAKICLLFSMYLPVYMVKLSASTT